MDLLSDAGPHCGLDPIITIIIVTLPWVIQLIRVLALNYHLVHPADTKGTLDSQVFRRRTGSKRQGIR